MNLSRNFENNNNNNQQHQQPMDMPNLVSSSGDTNNNLSNSTNNSPYEGNYQVDISGTNFELETITSSYAGLMRIYRLLYIADHCPALRTEAIFASLKSIQETHLTNQFKQVRFYTFLFIYLFVCFECIDC